MWVTVPIKISCAYSNHPMLFRMPVQLSILNQTLTAWKVSVFGVFLVLIFLHVEWIQKDYSVRMRENTDQKKLRIRTLLQWLLAIICFVTWTNLFVLFSSLLGWWPAGSLVKLFLRNIFKQWFWSGTYSGLPFWIMIPIFQIWTSNPVKIVVCIIIPHSGSVVLWFSHSNFFHKPL